MSTDHDVRALIDEWSAAYASKDLDRLMELFGDGDDVLVFGTGADEIRRGQDQLRAQAERDFGQADSLEFETGDVRIGSSGDVAWATMDNARVNASAGGQEMSLPIRATLVLVRGDGGWVVQHAHVSVPMAGQDEGQSFPTDGG
jgi:uncharacterized protein (TIGR02246 family)